MPYCKFSLKDVKDLISLHAEQYYISAPIFAIVEAKNENIVDGLGQCLATMIAAALFNERERTEVPYIYGSVTTGTIWKFLKLRDNIAHIDLREYYLKELGVLMGILAQIVQGEAP